jgi:hypothetical protein
VFGVALSVLWANQAHAQSMEGVRQDGGMGVDNAQAIAVDNLGNSYITGTFRIATTLGKGEANETVLTATGGQDIFVAKYDPHGMLLWARRGAGGCFFCQDWAWGIAVDASGNSYVAGQVAVGGDFGNGVTLSSPGAFVVKYDSAGATQWATLLDPGGLAYAIAVDADGHSFATGGATGPAPAFNPIFKVWKLDASGTPEWVRSTAGDYPSVAYSISVGGGTVSVTGQFSGTPMFGSGEPNQTMLSATSSPLFVAKYDSSGNLLWARQSSDGYDARANAISTDAEGNSYLAAVGTTILGADTANPIEVFNAFIAKYDGAGNVLWARTVAPPIGQVSWLFALATTPAGQTYVTGTVTIGTVFIEKYDADGTLLWMRRLSGVASTDVLANQASGIALDSAGNAYLAGYFSGTVRFAPFELNERFLSTTNGVFDFDIFLAKYLNDDIQNTPPVAYNEDLTATEDILLPIVLTADDADGNSLTYNIVTPPAHGQLIGTAPNLTYVPNPNFVGSDEFTFRVSDGIAFSNTATVTITVTPVNDAPIANDQAITTAQNTPFVITVTGSDIDSASLTFNVATGPSHGTLMGTSPAYTYTPALDYAGNDSFTFTASDGALISAPATVSITVLGFTTIGCGTLTSATIGGAGEVDRYSFVGHAGQIISLALASTGGFSANPTTSTSAELTVFTPSGASAGTIRSNSQANFTLTETGVYVLRVRATNLTRIGTYNLNLECLIPASGAIPLTCGTLASGQIAAPAQVDLFTWSGQAGQIISLALASSGGFSSNPTTSNSVELTVFAPSGAAAGTIRSNSQANFTLSQSGTYVARISATNLSTVGSYNLNLECLMPATAATVLTCGTLASRQIAAPAQVDLFTFSGQAGQILSLALASTGGFSSNPTTSNSVELTVFAPSGVSAGTIRSNSQANFTLSQSGTHVARISATNLSTVGSYNLNFECLSPVSTAVSLACGTLAAGDVTARAQIDLFTFSGQTGQIVSLALANTGGFSSNPTTSNSVELTVFAPSGTSAGTIRSNSQANFTLSQSGTYVVRVSATNLSTVGSYDLDFECLIPPSVAAVLTCGTLASGQIAAPAQVDLFTLSGQAGQLVSLALASTGGFSANPTTSNSVELTVFAPSGASAGTIRSNSQANFTLSQSGTYVVRVSATNLSAVGAYNLNFECLIPGSGMVALACGTSASAQIIAPAQVDLFTLTGQGGQVVSLALASTGGFSGNPTTSATVELTLFDLSGATVGVIRSNSQANFTLPQAGTYVVRVNATNLSRAGTYRLTLGCT